MVELVTKSYSEILFDLAKEENLLEAIGDELKEIAGIFSQNADYMNFLTSPQIDKEEKIKTVDAIFDGKINKLTSNFLKVLVSNGRISHIESIARYFKTLMREYLGIAYVEAVTATPMSEEQKNSLIEKLENKLNKKIELNNIVNESIIGGMKILVGEKSIDASVKTRLSELQLQLSKN